MRKFLIAAAALAIACPAVARAQEPVTVKFAFPAPPGSWANRLGITPWMEDVQKEAGGTLQIQFFPGTALGTFRNIYDRIIAGVVDMAFGTFGDLTGQFEKTSVTQLPTMSNAYIPTSIAIWRLYAKGIIADEFEKVHPLALYTFPGDGLHSPKPIKTLDDMKGLKIGLSSRLQSEIYSAVGAAPVTMIPTETYASVQRGLVDGISIGWPAVYTFKLNEVTKNHLSLGTGISPGYVFANKETMAKLPAKPRAAIDKYSGEAFAKRMGTASFNADKQTREALAKEGHTLVELNDADSAKLKGLLGPLVEAWTKATPDAQKVIDAYRREVSTVAASM
jgi:TRAP-type C4-dicarboxylate transport system substrate-binding protein